MPNIRTEAGARLALARKAVAWVVEICERGGLDVTVAPADAALDVAREVMRLHAEDNPQLKAFDYLWDDPGFVDDFSTLWAGQQLLVKRQAEIAAKGRKP